MEKITRKVTATVIHYSEAVLENGMPAFKECPSELVADAVDATQALAYLRKKYGTDRSFLVTGLETSTKKYEMDLALFVKTATPVMEVNAVPDAEPEAEQTTPAAPTSSLLPRLSRRLSLLHLPPNPLWPLLFPQAKLKFDRHAQQSERKGKTSDSYCRCCADSCGSCRNRYLTDDRDAVGRRHLRSSNHPALYRGLPCRYGCKRNLLQVRALHKGKQETGEERIFNAGHEEGIRKVPERIP